MITSTEKNVCEIQHPAIIQILSKLGTKWTCHNLIKATFHRHT